MTHRFTRGNLVAAMLITGFSGLATLLPLSLSNGGSTASILGYQSLCPFSPISTVLLLYAAEMIRVYIKRIG